MGRRLPLLLFLLPPLLSLPLKHQAADPLLSTASSTNRVPIALLHMYDSASFFQRLGAVTGENKARYARRWRYDMIVSTPHNTSGVLKQIPCDASATPDHNGLCWTDDTQFDIDHSRAPTFGKIRLTLAACRGRDNGWILWSDADALVMNHSLPLEALIDDGYDLMFTYDWLMMNAGMLLMKCSTWTKNFLGRVYNARKFDTARALDQSSFQEHLDNLSKSEFNQHVKVVPKYAMNVYTEEYRPGDFLMHFAGKLYEATEPGIVAIAKQFDVLAMADDIEDVRAFFRGERLLGYYSAVCAVDRGHRQAECKPDDPRRIVLNESLGSMSYPNRYRHVGLRYYWLGAWKDKYDVPGWDTKRKQLPLPVAAPPGEEMPPVPVSSRHEEVAGKEAAAKVEDGSKVDLKVDDQVGVHEDEHVPEVDHEAELPHEPKGVEEGDHGADDNNPGLEGGRDEQWSLLMKGALVGVAIAGVAGGVAVLRGKRKKSSKIQ